MFKNREEAGKRLAQRLENFKGTNAVVLAIPRGGLPIGAAIADHLNLPLDVVLSKKIGHPNNKEYAIGAVSLESLVLDQQAAKVPGPYITEQVAHIRDLLKERQSMYYKDRDKVSVHNRTVIVTDDGIATGNTALSTIELIHHEGPERIILAIPVAPRSAIDKLKESPYIDQIICLETPFVFHAVGAFYEHFDQVSDEEAISYLQAHRPKPGT